MNVIYSTDENYEKICMASIWSLLDYNISVKELNIYIIDNKIEKETKQKMIKLIQEEYKRKVIFISCQEICKNLEKENNFPISAYARLFIQDYVREDKIIYIDCDTIVKQSLQELWKTNLEENWIAGVQDSLPDYLKKVIEMNKDDRYINSGVLLINLKAWREIDFRNKVIKYIKEHKNNVIHHDQGIINGICKGKILYLDPKYNLMPEMIMMNEEQLKKLYKMDKFYSEKELKNARANPCIIHYISKFYNRPWFQQCTHPYKVDFLKYYKRVEEKLVSRPLNKKVKMRKFVFKYFPFEIYVIIERILNFKRRNNIK